MLKRIYALLRKDILPGFRQKHSFYGVLLYIASTIFVLYLSIYSPEANVWNGYFTHCLWFCFILDKKKLINARGGLHNRITQRIKLQPFDTAPEKS